ncbi:MAG: TIGR00341 family protein [Pseudomonadales bacterium]
MDLFPRSIPMSVVAFVGDSSEAEAVVIWGGRFAAARQTELIVFYAAEARVGADLLLLDSDLLDEKDEFKADPVRAAILKALKRVVRSKNARKGRIPRHATQIRRVAEVNPIAETIAELRLESPDLFIVASLGGGEQADGKSLGRQIAAKTTCDTMVLFHEGPRSATGNHFVVGTTEGTHDKAAIEWAAETAAVLRGRVTAVAVEAAVGQGAVEVGERALRSMLRELNLEESPQLAIKAVTGESTATALAEEANDCDLLLVGANFEKKLPLLLESSPRATIASLRKAPRLAFNRGRQQQSSWLFPQLHPNDYADLYEKLQSGSRWNTDFIVMLSLASGIAALGLLQSSPAVVIGSMLLAPLMTPMIGMGLALNQGNKRLAYMCFRAIGRGFLAALVISFVVGRLTPGSDLTPEIFARTEPNILDLLVALFSGMAAAYAIARPSLAGSIAGVAIATALVPPLCSVGISLSYWQYHEAVGAIFLLMANVLAIILAAAATFRMMGLRAFTEAAPQRIWVRHVVAGLMLCVLAVSIPLTSTFMRQVLEGKDSPAALAVTNEVRDVLLDHVDKMPGVEILFAGRPGIHRTQDPVDFAIILSSSRPLPRSEGQELIRLVQNSMENPELRVKVGCAVTGWTGSSTESGLVVSAELESE